MSNYSNGAELERAAKKSLEADGYYVIRSAGSKGLADLIALKPGELLLVQCKRRYIGPAERMAFRMLAIRLGALPLLGEWVKEGRAARVVGFSLMGIGDARSPWCADRAAEAAARTDALIEGGM